MADIKTPADADPTPLDPQSSGAIDTAVVTHDEDAELSIRAGDTQAGKIAQSLRNGTDRLAGQAGDKARGLVAQGLERGSELLGNLSKTVGDTADGIEERLGSEYGDYARKAATTLDRYSSSLSTKSADDLIEDTRSFVKKSPGVALAGAAVVGFVIARLLKSGLGSLEDDKS